MASKRLASSKIDWAAFAAFVPEQQKPQFNALKTQTEGYQRNIAELPDKLPAINWDHYKTRIAVPGMVAEFQKQYDALAIPYPKDTYTEAIEKKEKEEDVRVVGFCKASVERIAKNSEEIAKIAAMMPYEDMTMEDFFEAHPEWAMNPENPTYWPHTYEESEEYFAKVEEEEAGQEDEH